MKRPQLFGLAYSPWTERARWALDHHRIVYDFHEHIPLVGEALLRYRTRRWSGPKATVPLLLTEHETIGDSLDILLHAERVGGGSRLVADENSLRKWFDRVERGLQAVRARVTARVLADPEALRESAKAVAPEFLTGAMRPVAALGAKFIAYKYGADVRDVAQHEAVITNVVDEIREEWKQKRDCNGSSLQALDVLFATFLQGVRPVSDAFIPLTPAVRNAWAFPSLAQRSEDLLAWRDELYRTTR